MRQVDHVKVAIQENPGAMPDSKIKESRTCKKCASLEERLLAEASKINGLTKKV